jgi:hypothetical protein
VQPAEYPQFEKPVDDHQQKRQMTRTERQAQIN